MNAAAQLAISDMARKTHQAPATQGPATQPAASALLNAVRSLWQPLTARQMAERELAEAERQRLQALSAAEYAEAMALYHAQRIDRLRAYLKECNE